MSDILIIVIVGAVGVIGGYLFGLLDGRVTSKLKEGNQQELQVVPEVSALSIVFDFEHNIQVKMQGEPTTPATISPEQREIVRKIVLQLRPYVETQQPQAVTVVEQPVAAASEPIPQVSAPTPPAQPSLAPVTPSVKINAEPISTNVFKSANYMLNKANKPAEKVAVTMVEQIDEVLQEMVKGSALVDRQLAMRDGPGHTVIVALDGNEYTGIDAVPDPAIQALIRQAVAVWEKKNS